MGQAVQSVRPVQAVGGANVSDARDDWLLPLLQELAPATDVAAALDGDRVGSRGTNWGNAVAAGIASDDAILTALAARAHMHIAATLSTSDRARARIPERIARRYGVLPLSVTETTLDVATGNPYDHDCEQILAFVAGRRVRMSLASPMRIAERLDEVYRPANVIERLIASTTSAPAEQLAADETETDESSLADGARGRPIIKLVDYIVGEGIALGASDIHLEAEEGLIAVRYRIDGVLRHGVVLPKAIGLPLVSRVKIMARLDIADRLRPQGGRAVVTVGGERVDLRVSTLPAANGEKVVIRILDSRGSVSSLESLGLDDRDSAQLQHLLDIREGLLLVTGPTGSGKTTTLYAALKRLLDRGLNIVTVEDPVEYRIQGIVQVQVNEKAGLTFAEALRSILRQDPDVILIGEIRDRETAAIAIQAALTGHLVFATLHTIDAASSIERMHDLGVEPVKVAAALKGVIAQRLLRRICNACIAPCSDPVSSTLWDAIPTGAQLQRGAGCKACGASGYKGRMAVIELITLTPRLTRLVATAAPVAMLCDAARESGSRSLWASGVVRVLNGETTADEVARVLEPDAPTTRDECSRHGEDESGADESGADESGADESGADESGADESGADEFRGEQFSDSETCGGAGDHPGDESSHDAYSRDARPHDAYSAHAETATESGVIVQSRCSSGDPVTKLKVGVVDVYIVDPRTVPWRVLTLRRAEETRCPGAWEAVHGHIEDGEAPEDAAVRELREETGLEIERLYNVTVHAFYLHKIATVEIAIVFCAFVDSTKPVRLGPEHQAYEWLPPERAAERYIWPRATQALTEITKLLGHGDAGAAEDVMRVR